MMVVSVFLGLVVIGCSCGSLIVLAAVNVGPECPACSGDSLLIRSVWMRRLIPWLERRWCLRCGWQGLTRRGRARPIEKRRHRRATQPKLGER